MERETKNIEYKQTLTQSYLKTVSAFANYGGGKIYFGISDQGETVGLDDPVKAALNMENQINDNIRPHPDFEIEVREDNTVILSVKKGKDTPYCYRGKAYKRNDSSTIEVTPFEYKNLVLKGKNMTFDELPAEEANLTFTTFEQIFYERSGIPTRFPDTWITLGLYNVESVYNNAALLLSDQNSFPGIDVVFYGENRNIIRRRERLENKSVIDLIEDCIHLFESEYTYETVDRLYRIVKERISVQCFREAITNAVVHREWQISSFIKAEFFPDHVTITSPGGLPDGFGPEDYLSDSHISLPRNTLLAMVFLRLGLIESLGSGIPQIRAVYASSFLKPEFRITDNMISVTLPELDAVPELTEEQSQIYHLIRQSGSISPSELQTLTGMTKSMIQRTLKTLLDLNIVFKTGKVRSVRYKIR